MVLRCRGFPHSQRCGKACISAGKTCRKNLPAINNRHRTCNHKYCGHGCLRNTKKCNDYKRVLRSLQNADDAERTFWTGKYNDGLMHLEHGYPPPQNACATALTNLDTDIMTLEPRQPGCKECAIAKHFCNPSYPYYGSSVAAYRQVLTQCD